MASQNLSIPYQDIDDRLRNIGTPADSPSESGSLHAKVKALQDEPSLHDLWLKAGATYQKETNTYTLNGLAGLTKDDMLVAWRETSGMLLVGPQMWRYQGITCKTNFLAKNSYRGQASWSKVDYNDFTRCFYVANKLEVLRVSSDEEYGMCCPRIADDMFYACGAHTVLGVIEMSKCTSANGMFQNNYNIQNIKIAGLKISLSLSQAKALTVDDTTDSSLGYMIEKAKNTNPITITLHAEAFARVPQSLIQKAQAKQITIASA